MALAVDMRVFGDRKLSRAMARLPEKLQRRTMKAALRKSARRLRAALAPQFLPIRDTGRLHSAIKRAPIRMGRRRGKFGPITLGLIPPTRAELGISAEDRGYYPYALEYGTVEREGGRGSIQEYRIIRKNVDDNTAREISAIAADLRTQIPREWAKLTK